MNYTALANKQHRNVSDWLSYIHSIHPSKIELGLERIRKVAGRLDVLQLDCPVVTVAGTNGKGSTVALLESILLAQGYKVASYTSPHIHKYNERIKFNGETIDDDELCDAFSAVEHARNTASLSFFEYGTLTALYWFSLCKPDVIILEVGLGGRLDAVNVISADVAVITSIDIDHTEWLGDNRESIGYEKAGIAREGKICICGDDHPPDSVLALKQKGVHFRRIGEDFSYRKNGAGWQFDYGETVHKNLQLPKLFGKVQFNNSSCVLAVLEHLKDRLPVDSKTISEGLSHVNLSGRFQIEEFNNGRAECVEHFDIAHNPQGVQTMLSNLKQLPQDGYVHGVFAVLNTKDVHGMLAPIASHIDYWYISQNESPSTLPTQKLYEILSDYVPTERIFTYPTVTRAYQSARRHAQDNDQLISFGSVITVAEALRASQSFNQPTRYDRDD